MRELIFHEGAEEASWAGFRIKPSDWLPRGLLTGYGASIVDRESRKYNDNAS